MWVAELKLWHEGSEILEITKKFDVTAYSIYLNVYTKNRKSYISKVMAIHGKDAKKAIAALLAEMKRYIITKVEGNYVFFSIPVGALSYHTSFLDENVFFVKPFVIKGGHEYWTVASWDKTAILQVVRKIRRDDRRSKVELLGMKDEPVDLFVPDVMNKLSKRQFWAYAAAVQAGYYRYPRAISLKGLAKRLGSPPATLREHLRKAEDKILPVVFNQFQRR